MARTHVCVWLDHSKATVFELAATGDDFEVGSHDELQRVLSRAGDSSPDAAGMPIDYFKRIAAALNLAILIVGPDTTRNEFAGYIVEHESLLRSRISDIEAMDGPTPDDVARSARKFFRVPDRMHAPVHNGGS
jgi:hypothetical protein